MTIALIEPELELGLDSLAWDAEIAGARVSYLSNNVDALAPALRKEVRYHLRYARYHLGKVLGALAGALGDAEPPELPDALDPHRPPCPLAGTRVAR